MLWNDDVGLAEIRTFITDVAAFVSKGSGRSCFLVNTALAVDGDPEVSDRCSRNQDHIVRSFANALRGAVRRGELDRASDIDGTTLSLTGLIYGMNVMARNGSTRDTLGRCVDAALASLG